MSYLRRSIAGWAFVRDCPPRWPASVPELDRAFAELAGVLRPAGRLVVGIGEPDAMARMPMTPYGFRLRPVAEVIAALETAPIPPHEPVQTSAPAARSAA